MSDSDHKRGLRDGKKHVYHPPHDKGIIGELIDGYTKSEIEQNKDYDQGIRHGR